jgi:phage terminase large subunit-like protein
MEKYRVENVNIKDWVDRGIVTASPGAAIDYDFIMNDIVDSSTRFKVAEIAYDNWQSKKLIDSLDEMMPNTVFAKKEQSLKHMSAPSKEFERLIIEDKIIDPNPVMKWMVGNAVVQPDANNNYKPLKIYKSSTKRIDGVITSIMAIERANANEGSTNFEDILNLF